MKQSIAGTWLFGIVLVFMTIFIAYVAISINYNHAFKIKSDMVQILEQYQGINSKSLEKLEKKMQANSYSAKGTCQNDPKYIGVLGVNGQTVTVKNQISESLTGKYNYCVYLEKVDKKYYYTVEVFLKFNLPVLGDLFDFRIIGETNPIEYPYETKFNI